MTSTRSFVAFAMLVATSTAVHAQQAAGQAESLFRDGRRLMAEGKFAEACAAFEGSQKLDPQVTTLLNLGECREKNGQFASAWSAFLEAERQLRTATDDSGQKFHQVALDRSDKLETKVSKLTINVAAESRVDRLEIQRGSDPVDPSLWNRALPIDGGTYKVTAHAPGTSEWSTTVTVGTEGDSKTVDIPKLQSVAAEAEPSSETPASKSKVVPLAFGVGAVVLLGGAVGFELSSESTYDMTKTEPDPVKQNNLWDSANKKRYLAEGMAVAGLGCAGVAVWLLLRDSHHETPRSKTALAGRMIVVPTIGGVSISGHF